MKKIQYVCTALAVTAALTACSDEKNIPADGEGRLLLTAAVNSDLTVVARAEVSDQELADKCEIWITKVGHGLQGV